MPKTSAGVILYRASGPIFEVLLVHPGGPFWRNRDEGAWSIPKGEYEGTESPLEAAQRELAEEIGLEVGGHFIPLGQVRQPGGKLVTAWAVEANFDPATLTSNTFTMAWPPRSKTLREFPEIDRAEWFSLGAARRKLLKGQTEFLDRLAAHLAA